MTEAIEQPHLTLSQRLIRTLKLIPGLISANLGLLLVAFLILVLAVAAWLFYINRSKQPTQPTISSTSTNEPTLTAAQIQDIMNPKNTNTAPGGVATGTAGSGAVLGAQIPSPQTAPATPTTPTPTTPPAPLYQNSALGFAITLPQGWTASPQPGGSKIVFSPQNSRNTTNAVEVYNTTDTLDNVAKQLAQSPGVTKVQRTTLFGQQAVSFMANGRQGAAIIANQRLYYMFGEVVSGQLSGGFKFI